VPWLNPLAVAFISATDLMNLIAVGVVTKLQCGAVITCFNDVHLNEIASVIIV
jgi:hypothetical protein